MIRKSIYIASILIIIHTTTACWLIGGSCEDSKNYNVIYQGIYVEAINTLGFENVTTIDSAYKYAFGLQIHTESERQQIAYLPNFSLIKSAYALSCAEYYYYPDPIENMKIFIASENDNTETEVTQYFKIKSYYDEAYISINELFANREEWHDFFQIKLETYDSIPNKAKFKALLYLESGITLKNETPEIRFVQ